ncbi:MAG: hypothetical protein LBR42_03465 [Candidatus Methanoplasma sp.]|jgi:hypothetical protein|nr:hypothetical protein [Candidatus Methanoplasma sp.]
MGLISIANPTTNKTAITINPPNVRESRAQEKTTVNIPMMNEIFSTLYSDNSFFENNMKGKKTLICPKNTTRPRIITKNEKKTTIQNASCLKVSEDPMR